MNTAQKRIHQIEILKYWHVEFFYFDISTKLNEIDEGRTIETIMSQWNMMQVDRLEDRDIIENLVKITIKYCPREISRIIITGALIGLSEGSIDLDKTADMLLSAINHIGYKDFCRKFLSFHGEDSIEKLVDRIEKEHYIYEE